MNYPKTNSLKIVLLTCGTLYAELDTHRVQFDVFGDIVGLLIVLRCSPFDGVSIIVTIACVKFWLLNDNVVVDTAMQKGYGVKT